MYIGHTHLVPVCLSLATFPHYCMNPDVTWEWWGVPSSCALLGRFACGARVSLLWQHSAECEMLANAVLVLALCLVDNRQVAMSVACCGLSGYRHEEVRARLVAASSHWAALAWCTRRIMYKLSVMMYSCLHGQAPQYLLDVCQPVSDVTSRRHLRSAGRRLQNIPRQRRNTFARRAFSVAGLLVWNSLTDYLRDPAVSRDSFCKHLKTFSFGVYWYTQWTIKNVTLYFWL